MTILGITILGIENPEIFRILNDRVRIKTILFL